MIASGTVIDGRYEVLSRIGTGGMADVYLARDQLLGRQVAVKVLHQRFVEDQEFVERFRREASSAASLSHPNVVAIFDRGEWDGTYYIAMEYLPGRSLKTVIREQGPLDPVSAIDIVTQVLHAARFAHGRGLIHRDLKPHNVILDEEGRAKVTDFGIARAGASDMTLTGSIMGTAQYLSPEQAQGHAVSAASDLYAVGIVLYELLTGTVPFDGETAVTIALKQVSAVPPPPSSINPAVPAELDAVVLRALAKDPAARFASAEEFLLALEYVRRAIAAEPGGVSGNGPVPEATAALLLPPAEPRPEGERDNRRWWWIAGAALLLAAAVAVALLLLLGPSKHQVTVPNVTGQTQAAATAQLAHAGLTAVPSSTPSTVVAAGLVTGENPPHGSVVERGTRVTIFVSSGPGTAVVPDVRNLAEAQALQKLKKAGFKPVAQSQASSTVQAGKVISTEPSAHTEAQAGSPVTVLVSSGPVQVQVPEVVGQSEAEAKASLRGAGLQPGTITHQEASAGQVGTVLSQSPPAGNSVASGQRVNLVVAQAPKESTVPRVVGRREELAEGELVGAGFKPKTQKRTVSKPEEAGIVLQQTPAGGTKAKPGSTVTIVVGQLDTPTTPSATTTTPSTTPSTTPAPPAGSATQGDHGRAAQGGAAQGGAARGGVADGAGDRGALAVALLAGGRSSEHDVSLASAGAVREGLEQAGHAVHWVQIERDGTWWENGERLCLTPGEGLLGVDVAFPVLHGPFGEDGTVQGVLESLDVAYVGSGVAASALCLDKVRFKELMAVAGVPQVAYIGVREERWAQERDAALQDLARLGLPVFVKPAHLGSSVGIVKVEEGEGLARAVTQAFTHDPLVIVEAMARGVEVECAVLGLARSEQYGSAAGALASQPGEIVLPGEWYDYEAKYAAGGMELILPARISPEARARVRKLALEVFSHAGCEGLARVDFFVEGETVLVNELNTMPGFTPTSVYAKLIEAAGISYAELVDRLCRLGLERHARRRAHSY